MRHFSFILTALLCVLLVGGAVGIYYYDAARSDLIAEGITAGEVNVGGMRAAEARAALEDELARPLARPVWIRHGDGRVKLTAKRAKVRTDIEGMVQKALASSRDGNVLSRAWRDVRGESVPLEIPSEIKYSKAAVARMVAGLKKQVDQPAKDAEVAYSGDGLSTIPSETGVALQAGRLTRSVSAELVSPHGRRMIRARTSVVQPKVKTSEVASKYPYFITVSRTSKELRFYRGLELEKSYRVAIGRAGFETPTGLYHIQNKAVNVAWNVPEWGGKLAGQTIPGGSPKNPLKARWLGIYDGAGIHGTDDIASLGTAASHGCIRMAIPEVIELYDKVPVQTPIYIA